MSDPFDLKRFVEAQEPVIEEVLDELRQGRKRTHWMWFSFPQLAGLGRSDTARKYGIASLDEARAYLDHPVLGPRLRECTGLAMAHSSVREVFGSPDDLKFRSCMTLFAHATQENRGFLDALERFFAGHQDELTLQLLASSTELADPSAEL